MTRRPRWAAALILCAAISAALMPGGARAQEVRHATWGITFPTSQSGRAQDEFLNGLTAYHLCMFEDALEHFRAAQKLAPDFAMAYWGEALAHHRPIWSVYERDEARAALNRLAPTPAGRQAKAPTARERAYLTAVEVLYADGPVAERERAFSEAMGRLSDQYPDDSEALALYTLTRVLRVVPRSNERERLNTAAMALEVLRRNPRHPGAPRYLIQTVNDPVHASLGLLGARAIEAWPEAGGSESVHIPSHISMIYGWWEKAEAANRRAFEISMDWTRRHGVRLDQLNVHNYGHLVDFRQYALLQLGRHRDAWGLVDRTGADFAASGQARPIGSAYFGARALYIVETGEWTRAAALADEARAAGFGGNASVLEAVGFGAARTGRLDAARSAADALAGLQGVQGRTAALEIRGLVALAEGDRDLALRHLKAAVDLAEQGGTPQVPNPAKPAWELYGEVLLDLDRPAEALKQFTRALEVYRNRSAAVVGAARAHARLGDRAAAERRYREVLANWRTADADHAGVREARTLLESQ